MFQTGVFRSVCFLLRWSMEREIQNVGDEDVIDGFPDVNTASGRNAPA